MTDVRQRSTTISWIDVITFGLAALMPIFFLFMLWYGSYPAVSYINDLPTPRGFDFNDMMWLLPVSIVGALSFALWGLLDVHRTAFTSRAVAGFAGLGLLYYLWLGAQEGFDSFDRFTHFTLVPAGDFASATTIPGGSAFYPLLFLLVFLVVQAAFPREAPQREPGEPAPKLIGPVSMPLGIGGFFLANLILFILLANWGSILSAGDSFFTFLLERDSRDANVVVCSDSDGCAFWHPVIYTALLLAVVITGFAYTTLLERKLIAWFQQRVGPNRVGPGGFLQPAADGLKLIFKENILPAQADKPVYRLAPMLKAIPTLVVLAVIPLGPPIVLPWFDGNWYEIPLGLADPGVGVLWLLAITSIGTYGVVLAGWASNNKYAMLGGMRAASQMVSYELSMGITMAVPVLIAGSMSIGAIVADQGGLFINWYIFQNPLAAIILMIALVAETNRAPFDLPEAEQELTAGYMTEYSGMRFALFMMAEYLGMIAVSAIAVSLFLGGFNDGFGLVDTIPILGPLVFIGKVILLLMGFVWLRATLPRLRYDRLMMLGWKVMLPLALLSVVWTAVAVVVGEELGSWGYVIVSSVMIVLLLAGSVFFLGRPERDDADDDIESDPVITGEQDGLAWAALAFVGGLVAIPFTLFAVVAPLLALLWAIITVPLLAIFNLGDSRERLRRGLLVVVEPIANMGRSADEDDQPADEDADAPQLGSGD